MATFATTTSVFIKMVGTQSDSATTQLVGQCLDDAENEIKKWLSKRYDLTATYFTTYSSVPPMVRTLAIDLTVGYAYENMARGSKEGYARADRYIKRVMENLKAIAAGEVQLYTTAGGLITESMTDFTVYENSSSYSPTFNEDDPKNWAVSQNKLDDIEDERDE